MECLRLPHRGDFMSFLILRRETIISGLSTKSGLIISINGNRRQPVVSEVMVYRGHYRCELSGGGGYTGGENLSPSDRVGGGGYGSGGCSKKDRDILGYYDDFSSAGGGGSVIDIPSSDLCFIAGGSRGGNWDDRGGYLKIDFYVKRKGICRVMPGGGAGYQAYPEEIYSGGGGGIEGIPIGYYGGDKAYVGYSGGIGLGGQGKVCGGGDAGYGGYRIGGNGWDGYASGGNNINSVRGGGATYGENGYARLWRL
jgi:hypothetical protein